MSRNCYRKAKLPGVDKAENGGIIETIKQIIPQKRRCGQRRFHRRCHLQRGLPFRLEMCCKQPGRAKNGYHR